MTRGNLDWTLGIAVVTSFDRINITELANRLRQPSPMDGLGELKLFTNFESPVGEWSFQNGGTGSYAYLSIQNPQTGALSAKLRSGSTTGSEYADVGVALYPPAAPRLGFQFSHTALPADATLEFHVLHYSGSQLRTYRAELNASLQKLRYRDATGAAVEFANWREETMQQEMWIPAKLVIDITDHHYVRFVTPAASYNISAGLPLVSASTTPPRIVCRARLLAGATFTPTIFVEGIIVTTVEPA